MEAAERDPKTMTRVRDKREGGVWSVVLIDGDQIGLSGPLPCRGMKYVDRAEFDEFWESAD